MKGQRRKACTLSGAAGVFDHSCRARSNERKQLSLTEDDKNWILVQIASLPDKEWTLAQLNVSSALAHQTIERIETNLLTAFHQ